MSNYIIEARINFTSKVKGYRCECTCRDTLYHSEFVNMGVREEFINRIAKCIKEDSFEVDFVLYNYEDWSESTLCRCLTRFRCDGDMEFIDFRKTDIFGNSEERYTVPRTKKELLKALDSAVILASERIAEKTAEQNGEEILSVH